MFYISRDLPQQPPPPAASLPDEYTFILDENIVPSMSGELCESAGLAVQMDVCVYTESKENRPWLGRLEDSIESVSGRLGYEKNTYFISKPFLRGMQYFHNLSKYSLSQCARLKA